MKKTLLTLAALAAVSAVPAHADVLLGGKAAVDGWFADGKVNNTEYNDVDTVVSGYVALEHPIPLIPNARIGFTPVEIGTDGFAASFDQVDYTAYYEILDNDLVSLDLGVSLQNFQNGKLNGKSFDEWVPAVFGDARVNLPMTGLGVFATVNAGSYDDNTTRDMRAGIQWSLPMAVADLNLRGGYRKMDYDFDGVTKNGGKVELDGFFMGAELDF